MINGSHQHPSTLFWDIVLFAAEIRRPGQYREESADSAVFLTFRGTYDEIVLAATTGVAKNRWIDRH
jgi:hypothetical protein